MPFSNRPVRWLAAIVAVGVCFSGCETHGGAQKQAKNTRVVAQKQRAHLNTVLRPQRSSSTIVVDTPRPADLHHTGSSLDSVLVQPPTLKPKLLNVELDIAYEQITGGTVDLDMYAPEGAINRPVVILIHGGGWRSGDKSHLTGEAQSLAQSGFVVLNINYRLVCLNTSRPLCGYTFPTPVIDAATALTWARSNVQNYGGDSRRIAVFGLSSGGQIAEMLGVGAVRGVEPPQAVVAWSAPLPRLLADHPEKSTLRRLIGCPISECPDVWQAASQDTYVDGHTSPMLIVNSELERVPINNAQAMARALDDHRVPFTFLILPGSEHPPTYEERVWRQTVRYLEQSV